MDTNVPASILEQAAERCSEFWVEPVSVAKAAKLRGCLKNTSLTSPNLDELRALVEATGTDWLPVDDSSLAGLERTLPAAVEPLFCQGVRYLLVTCGALGAVLCSSQALSAHLPKETFGFQDPDFTVTRCQWAGPTTRTFVSYTVPQLNVVESVTGAGDSLIAGTAWAYSVAKASLTDAVLYGLAAARLCLASTENVSPLLSVERITPCNVSSRL